MKRLALIPLALLALAPSALAGAPYPSVSPIRTETQRIGLQSVTVSTADGTTSVSLAGGNAELAGSWGLPIVTLRGHRAGLAFDGSAAVVVQRAPARGRSVFAVVDALGAHVIDLAGSFTVDALAPDGSKLYVVEHLAGGGGNRYAVRTVDVASGRLAAERLATKDFGESWEPVMDGRPYDRVVSADGSWVFTLYRGRTRPFVHALRVARAFAFCFDLPKRWQGAAARLRLRLSAGHAITIRRSGELATISVDAPGITLS